EWFEPEKELIDYIESFSPGVLTENEQLRRKLELAEKRAEQAEEKALTEIKAKVLKAFGEETPKKGEVKPPIGGTTYFRTSVKNTEEEPAIEVVKQLVHDENIWAFSEGAGKRKINPGDYICFYAGKVGVIAHARVKSAPTYQPKHPKVDRPKEYPWIIQLEGVKFYPDNPVLVQGVLPKLDMAKGADKEKIEKHWGPWFMGTSHVSEHDFKVLTRQ
ncbi:MAG: hypothetical protein AB1861_09500, partial [Cyanobacteriota bacterium]